MNEKRLRKLDQNSIFLIILVIIIIVLETLSCTIYRTPIETRLLLRVISRGVFGILAFDISFLYLFTSNQSFFTKNKTASQRKIGGILVGFIGIILIVTALLGYGTNGDPRLIWWK